MPLPLSIRVLAVLRIEKLCFIFTEPGTAASWLSAMLTVVPETQGLAGLVNVVGNVIPWITRGQKYSEFLAGEAMLVPVAGVVRVVGT